MLNEDPRLLLVDGEAERHEGRQYGVPSRAGLVTGGADRPVVVNVADDRGMSGLEDDPGARSRTSWEAATPDNEMAKPSTS